MSRPKVFVTNFNRNFTGVSATAAAVLRIQRDRGNVKLVGYPLPGCPDPITKKEAIRLTIEGVDDKPFQIWHVRRNTEMQTALWVRDVLKLPIKIVFTSAAQRRHSAWPRFLISRMDAIIATTDDAANFAGNVWTVAPHGVDTSLFHPAENRAEAWANTGYPGQRGIACVGRVRPEKGTDLFVDTMISTLPDFPEATALVIGAAKGNNHAFLEEQIRKVAAAGLSGRILFVGEVSPDKFPELLRTMDMLVALPRYEGYGMTPLEAMASGVPIIASDTGHFREFLGVDAAEYIVPTGESAAALTGLKRLLSDPSQWSDYSVRLSTRARDKFDVRQEAAKISKVYDRLWAGENLHNY